MVHIHHRKKTPGGCIDRLARYGSCRESVRGVLGTMNAARSRPDWIATVQSGRKQAQSRVQATFLYCAGHVFLPYVSAKLENATHVDIVWDVYQTGGLKGTTSQNGR